MKAQTPLLGGHGGTFPGEHGHTDPLPGGTFPELRVLGTAGFPLRGWSGSSVGSGPTRLSLAGRGEGEEAESFLLFYLFNFVLVAEIPSFLPVPRIPRT